MEKLSDGLIPDHEGSSSPGDARRESVEESRLMKWSDCRTFALDDADLAEESIDSPSPRCFRELSQGGELELETRPAH